MAAKLSDDGKTVTMYLRDYLQPGGIFQYSKLPEHMQDFYDHGLTVHLVSVPGFLMASGYPPHDGKKGYFFSKNKSHKTAWQALEKD